MFPRVSCTGNIARHLQGGFKAGHPIVLVVLFSEFFKDSRTGVGRNVTEQYLVKLWPNSAKSYNDLVARFHTGAMVHIVGTMRTGTYQDNQGDWHTQPNIVVDKIEVLRKSAAVKAAEGVQVQYNTDIHYTDTGMEPADYDDGESFQEAPEEDQHVSTVVAPPTLPPVARRARSTGGVRKTTKAVTPKQDPVDPLDDDLPF